MNLFEYIVRRVYIIYILMSTVRSEISQYDSGPI